MKNLLKSLASFQQEVPVIHKNTQGYGYSYADLTKIFEVINPLLKKHGLGFTQTLHTRDDVNYIATMVFHIETGEHIESSIAIPYVQLKGMNDFQSFGSGVTYYRRYAISAALALVTDKDTDAAGEQVKTEKKLPVIDQKRFQAAVTAIHKGEYTREKLEASFALTEGQIDMLNAL